MRRFVLGSFAILLAIAAPTIALAQDTGLFASGGMVFTRGHSPLSDYFDRGASLSLGTTRKMLPHVHALGRVDYAYLPYPGDAAPYYGLPASQAGGVPAHLVTAGVGLRFRARELAITPFYDIDVGGALLSMNVDDGLGGSRKLRRLGLELAVGAGVIRRLAPRLHLFMETRWVTTWGAGTMWTVPVRVGVERR